MAVRAGTVDIVLLLLLLSLSLVPVMVKGVSLAGVEGDAVVLLVDSGNTPFRSSLVVVVVIGELDKADRLLRLGWTLPM